MFMYSEGHIYYNNDVIKIRYDLLYQSKNIQDMEEYEIFDYYKDIIKINEFEQVQSQMPIPENKSKRLIYLIKNRALLSCK